jgi:predicted MFS family arabinose efflux permease
MASYYGLFAFFGVWAIGTLRLDAGTVAATFAAGGALSILSGPLGGRAADAWGRRRVLLGALLAQAAAPAALAAGAGAGGAAVAVLALSVVLCANGARSAAAEGIIGAAATDTRAREEAYAVYRVAFNAGAAAGPLLGGLLLTLGWSALFAVVAALPAAGALIVWSLDEQPLPAAAPATSGAPARRSRVDGLLLAFLAGGVLAATVYSSYEVLLPVALLQDHGYSPSLYGVLATLNPAIVLLSQVRVTRAAARVPPAPRVALAILAMGLPFLLLPVAPYVPVAAAAIIVFVVGEMLWAPTVQSALATAAPPERLSTYLGSWGATMGAGLALAPLLGLPLRDHAGEAAMWAFIAVVGIAGAAVTSAAVAFAFARPARPLARCA